MSIMDKRNQVWCHFSFWDILYHFRKFIFVYIIRPFGGTRDGIFFLSKEPHPQWSCFIKFNILELWKEKNEEGIFFCSNFHLRIRVNCNKDPFLKISLLKIQNYLNILKIINLPCSCLLTLSISWKGWNLYSKKMWKRVLMEVRL